METTAIFSVFISIISLLISVWSRISSNQQILSNQRINIFAEYTKRYQDIILSMPHEIYNNNEDTSNPLVLKYMMLYFNLCSEEFYLRQEKFVPSDVWDKWVEGMRITVRHAVYKAGWEKIAHTYNAEFCQFINNEIFKR